jgi:hypothetical protein
VLDTRTCPGCAIATMRDAMWTAIPLRSLFGHFDFARVKSRPHLQAKILDGLAYGQRTIKGNEKPVSGRFHFTPTMA